MRLRPLAGLAILALVVAACDLPGNHSADAAVVDGKSVPKAKWEHVVEVTTLQLRQKAPFDPNSDDGKQKVRNLEVQALRAVVREQVIEDFAAERHVVVTQADVDKQVQQLNVVLGPGGLNQRLDQTSETMGDLRGTIRLNLLQAKMRAASPTYDADFNKRLLAAQVNAYVPPCDSDHQYPRCTGGPA